MADSIYELFKKVREHPDYRFGAIFTMGDIHPVTDDERKQGEQAMTAAGFEYIENALS